MRPFCLSAIIIIMLLVGCKKQSVTTAPVTNDTDTVTTKPKPTADTDRYIFRKQYEGKYNVTIEEHHTGYYPYMTLRDTVYNCEVVVTAPGYPADSIDLGGPVSPNVRPVIYIHKTDGFSLTLFAGIGSAFGIDSSGKLYGGYNAFVYNIGGFVSSGDINFTRNDRYPKGGGKFVITGRKL